MSTEDQKIPPETKPEASEAPPAPAATEGKPAEAVPPPTATSTNAVVFLNVILFYRIGLILQMMVMKMKMSQNQNLKNHQKKVYNMKMMQLLQ